MARPALIFLLCPLAAANAGIAANAANTANAADANPLARLQAGQPRDVRRLIERLAACAHWSGEDPYDAARRREIAAAVKDWRCARLDADQAAALRRHAHRPAVRKALQAAREAGG